MIALKDEDDSWVTVLTTNIYDVIWLDSWAASDTQTRGRWRIQSGFIEYEVFSWDLELLASLKNSVKERSDYHDVEYFLNNLPIGW